MSRGKHLHTKVKEAVRLASSEAEAIRIGSEKALAKMPLDAKQVILRLIDKIDPLEVIAILGATYLIKRGIDWGEDLAADLVRNPPNWMSILSPLTALGIGVSPLQIHTTILTAGSPFLMGILNPNIFHVENTSIAQAEKAQAIKDFSSSTEAEAIEWLISFLAAFLLIRNAKEITTSIVGQAKQLLGLLPLAV